MTMFDERRDAYENRFAHDATLRFQAIARRDKMLARWVAEELGKSGSEAESYLNEVIALELRPGDHDVLRKIKTDLEAAGRDRSEAEIRAKMDQLMARAVDDIRAGRA